MTKESYISNRLLIYSVTSNLSSLHPIRKVKSANFKEQKKIYTLQ